CTAAQITAAGASTEARFGAALAMQGDRLLVGAPGEAVAGAPRQGAAYAFDARASGPAIPRGRVVAADGDADDAFGSSLALDGTTIAIGAPGALAAEGMAYVFVQGGNSYQLQQAFGEPDGGLLDLYGASVALRGDRLAIGVELDNLAPNRGQGSVATWIRVGTTWTAGERIATGDGASREQFGASVAIDGAIAIVGSPLDDPAIDSDDAGTATVYRREGAGWLREARLVASDAFTQDLFGFAVDASQDRVLVGTPRAIVAGRNDQGAAYVFRREGVDWIEEAKLVAPDGAMDEFFGAAVAIDADTALVGAPFHNGDGFERGAGYVFRRSGQAWQFEAKLESPAFPPLGVAGLSVALDGGLAVLGAPDSTVGDRQFQGLVHVFVDAGDTWSIGATIAAPDAGPGDAFGSAVALDGGELVVGAAQDTEGGLANAGSAYVFTGNAGGDAWQLRRRLVAPEPDAAAFFGAAVAIADGRALVGCIGFDGVAENAGVAFLYERGEGDWPFAQSLQAVEPQAGALFGNGVALAPTSALVGEPLRDRVNPNEGAAYLFADGDRLFSDGFE
ncbi:MAG TPA: hypothetical protein VFO79_07320, partial [Xanthomonadales bacterium]|nr:hypothetical protein [Xanthomonadales bacterium]